MEENAEEGILTQKCIKLFTDCETLKTTPIFETLDFIIVLKVCAKKHFRNSS